MPKPVNLACLRLVAEQLREQEAPFKAAGDPRGLGIGASAIVLERAASELERLRDALHVARGALLCMGTDYAKEIAEAVAPALTGTEDCGNAK